MEKEYKDVRIRMGVDAVKELKKLAIDAGYDSFAEYLRFIIKEKTGVDTESDVNTWGGNRRDKEE